MIILLVSERMFDLKKTKLLILCAAFSTVCTIILGVTLVVMGREVWNLVLFGIFLFATVLQWNIILFTKR